MDWTVEQRPSAIVNIDGRIDGRRRQIVDVTTMISQLLLELEEIEREIFLLERIDSSDTCIGPPIAQYSTEN
jgi:hypothetical protein